jgi:NAD-dependent dihydropyrimidine dehydrogenase PreA subunit
MAVRKIVEIDEEKCDGCGLCVPSCAEGAIQIIDGKAKLVSDMYCDGLGACLGDCPLDAIKVIERDADEFDEQAVEVHLKTLNKTIDKPQPLTQVEPAPHAGGCPGSAMRMLAPEAQTATPDSSGMKSALTHWPVQLVLVPPGAPFLKNADLLICADCVPFTVPDFHSKYLAGKALLIGCPKLDDLDYYREKLKAMFAEAKPKSLTVLMMEVPCCTGIAHAALEARDLSAPDIPLVVETITIRGGNVAQEIPPRTKAV